MTRKTSQFAALTEVPEDVQLLVRVTSGNRRLPKNVLDTYLLSFANSPGQDGASILNGTGAPTGAVGRDGDFYIDTHTFHIYGPKTETWGNGVPMLGQDGEPGTGLNNRGTWETATYLPGDYVFAAGTGTAVSMWVLNSDEPYVSSLAPAEDTAHWIELVAPSGADGKAVELQVSATHVQWRLEGEAVWKDLVPLTTLRGPAGSSIELQKTTTHIQWRLIGSPTWTDLVTLGELKGDPGEGGGLADAPLDGISYVRKDGDWVEAPSGGEGSSGGDIFTLQDDGTIPHNGSYTPDPTTGIWRQIKNGGAITINAPNALGVYTMYLEVQNAAGAGNINFAGFALQPKGDAMNTNSGNKYLLHIIKTSLGTLCEITALQ